jgi:hypothetical protein
MTPVFDSPAFVTMPLGEPEVQNRIHIVRIPA